MYKKLYNSFANEERFLLNQQIINYGEWIYGWINIAIAEQVISNKFI